MEPTIRDEHTHTHLYWTMFTLTEILKEKLLSPHKDSNSQPSDSSLLIRALPSRKGFASLLLITLPLSVASTLVDLAEVTRITKVVIDYFTQSQQIHLSKCSMAAIQCFTRKSLFFVCLLVSLIFSSKALSAAELVGGHLSLSQSPDISLGLK